MTLEARRLVERILASPPRRSSALEALVGPLAIDFAGGEGMGSFARYQNGTKPPPPGLGSLFVSFHWDMHHEEPTRPRDLELESVHYELLLPPPELELAVTKARGSGRHVSPVPPQATAHLEYAGADGDFFYVAEGSSRLMWARSRPEWAHPRVEGGVREAALVAFFDLARTDATERELREWLEPRAAEMGIALASGIGLEFTPAIEVALIARVLGWSRVASFSVDVHMSRWIMVPLEQGRAVRKCSIGRWALEIGLEGWPRAAGGADLASLERVGPSPAFDLEGCVTNVGWISLR